MATEPPIAETLGRNSDLYDRYTERATAELAANEELQAARAEWLTFFTTSHGDVFRECDVESPRETLFVETLYVDFVVDRLIHAVERELDVRVGNPEATHNTGALSFDFRALHDAVLDGDAIGVTDATTGAGPIEHHLHDRRKATEPAESSAGFLRALYEHIVSPELRRQLGEYYTPRGVADLAVDELAVDDVAAETFLDPGCGSGVFLAACIDAKRAALDGDCDPATVVDIITNTVFGIDLNPVAVRGAKLTYLLALAPLLGAADIDSVELPVFLTDSLRLTRDDEIRFAGERLDLTVDHLVGNPPWITWGGLAESVRDAWREQYTEQLELLPHRGIESQLGHANDDISIPFVWVCLHRYLARDGDASFVLKRGAMKGPAGRLLRTQRVNGRPVSVQHVHDFTSLRPFGDGVDVDAAVYTIRADAEPEFPIDAHSWTRGDRKPEFSSADAIRNTLECEEIGLVPVDDPSSSWIRSDAEHRALGECDHDIRHGVKDDAAAVFDVDRDRLDRLEHDHVYPYLKSKDVVKYGLFSHGLRLVPMAKANEDNEAELRANCPETYAYLESHRETLEARSSSWLDGGPFYTVFGLGEYTWSPYKVVWCRLGFKPHFAVVSAVDDEDLGETPVVPGDHCMFIPTDEENEAHFLCGLLNSAVYQQSLQGLTSGGKASLSKSVVSRLKLPEYAETDEHRRLAELSMRAHDIVPEHTDVSKRAYNRQTIEDLAVVQAEIDALVERLVTESM